MTEYRCPDCDKLLFRYDIAGETSIDIEIMCKECKRQGRAAVKTMTLPHPLTGSKFIPASSRA